MTATLNALYFHTYNIIIREIQNNNVR